MALSLDMLDELVRQVQADMRSIRSEVAALRDEVGAMRSDMGGLQRDTVRAVADLIQASERRMMDRMAAFEAYVDTRIDRQEG